MQLLKKKLIVTKVNVIDNSECCLKDQYNTNISSLEKMQENTWC